MARGIRLAFPARPRSTLVVEVEVAILRRGLRAAHRRVREVRVQAARQRQIQAAAAVDHMVRTPAARVQLEL